MATVDAYLDKPQTSPPSRGERWLPLSLLLATLLFWSMLMAGALWAGRLDSGASGPVAVVFDWGTPRHEMFRILVAAGGRLQHTTWLGNIWVVTGDEAGFVGRLEQGGVLGAYPPKMFQNVFSLAGCF